MRRALVLLFLVACADGPGDSLLSLGERAQSLDTEVEVFLVADPHPGEGEELGSHPDGFIEVNGVVVFAATTEEHGTELWRSDGTSEGTRLLRDISPGPESSSPTGFIAYDGGVVFVATDDAHGRELWFTDGTEAGTRIFLDLVPGADSDSIGELTTLGGRLLVPADSRLWATDGSEEGTEVLSSTFGIGNQLVGKTSAGAFYRVFGGGSVHSFRRTAGTPETTVAIGGYWGAFGSVSATFADRLFFGRDGDFLVVTDGTEEGTRDVAPALTVQALVAHSDYLLAGATRNGEPGIWIVDDPEAPARLLHLTLAAVAENAAVALGSGMVFSSMDGLFYTDPDVAPRLIGPSATWVKNGGNRVFFAANVGAEGSQLFVTDGTAEGTHRLSHLPAGSGAFAPAEPAMLGGELWVQGHSAAGSEPWVADGEPGSLRQLANVQGKRRSSIPAALTSFDNGIAFRARSVASATNTLWVGRNAGPGEPIATITAPSGDMLRTNNRLLFVSEPNGTRLGLYTTFAQSISTQLPIQELAPFVGGWALFSSGTSNTGREPCVISATASINCGDVWAGNLSSSPEQFTAVGNGAFFAAASSGTGRELWWTTSGTSASLRDIRPGSASSTPEALTAVNGALWFNADNGTSGRELWRALPAGTPALVRDIWPGASGSTPRDFVGAGSLVLFTADTAPHGRELWRSDGTTAGTQLVKDIRPGAAPAYPRNLTSLGDRVFFLANDGSGTDGLFVSDGQLAGTFRLGATVIPPGLDVRPPLLAVGGALVFSGGDAAGGYELWRTTGVPGSTRQVVDLHPGPGSSHPRDLVRSGSQLYFTAWREDTGREVFSVPATAIDLPPSITCPEDFTVQAPTSAGLVVAYPIPEAFDEEGPVEISFAPEEGTRLPVGRTVVTATATDLLGTAVSCTFEVEVLAPPSLSCPPVSAEATGPAGAAVWFEALATDPANGGEYSLSYTFAPGSTFQLGTTSVGITATRPGGPTLSCNLLVTVVDTTPPEITCPADIVAEATSPQGAMVSFQATATDLVSTPTITYSVAPGSTFALGTRLVEATARDTAGNRASCSFSVTVQDTTPPTITCPEVVQRRPVSDAGAQATFAAHATDTVSSVTIGYSHPPGSLFPIGVTEVTATATDSRGNEATCSFEVRIEGPPHLSVQCPDPITAEVTSPVGTAISFAPEIYGGAPPVEVTYSRAPGSLFALGIHTVTIDVVAGDGESHQCLLEITVRDTIAPDIVCPTEVFVEATDPDGAVATFVATATDAAGDPILEYDPTSGSRFPLGSTPVTANARDATGNNSSCTFPVTVQDTTPPQVTCPEDIVLRPESVWGRVVSFAASATDAVSPVSISYSHHSGMLFPPGTTPVTVTASDQAGNQASCTFEVRIEGPPHLAVQCPDPIVAEATGPSGVAVSFAPGIYGGAPPVETSYSRDPGSTFALGSHTVVIDVVAADGESQQCQLPITVRDTTPPEITCPEDVIAEATEPQGAYVTFAATATDAVSVPSIAYSPDLGTRFPLGDTTVTATAWDGSNNTASCTFRVRVRDTTPPTLTCPGDRVLEATGPDGADLDYAITAEDAVSSPTVTYSHPPGTRLPLGETRVAVTAVDDAGNGVTCGFDVLVQDTTPPALTCPDRVVEAVNAAGAPVELEVEAVDLVSEVTVTFDRENGIFPLGTTVVQASGRDVAGNEATCAFEVRVVDTTPPKLTCPQPRTVEATGPDGAVVEFAATGSDPVSPVTFTYSTDSGSTFPLGTTSVEVQARDEAGNQSTCSFMVQVQDTTPPTIICPPPATLEATSPGGSPATYEPAFAEDAVSTASITYDPPLDRLLPLGTTLVEATAWDEAGNNTYCVFMVTVEDTTPPHLVCPGNFEVQAASTAGAEVTFPAAEASDLVSQPTVIFSPLSGSHLPMGETEVSVTASDAAGNSSACTFRVLVSNRKPPVISCPGPYTVEATRPEGAFLDFPPATVSGAFSEVEIDYSHPPGSVFPLGETQVEVNSRDAWNNTSSCTFAVLVRDTTAPEVSCPRDLTVEATSPQGAIAEWEVLASDAVSEPTVDAWPRSGARFPMGRTRVNVGATDAAGNVATCRFHVDVVDTTPPELTCPEDLQVTAGAEGTVFVPAPEVTAEDLASPVTVTLQPALDQEVPSGRTEVLVTARDNAGNVSTCTFELTVSPYIPSEEDGEPGELKGGCGCSGAGGEGALAGLGLLGLAALRRRRFRAES